MSFRNAYTHFADIQECIHHIEDFVEGITFEAYLQDVKTQSAVERQLLTISEAAIRLREDGENLAPGPDWSGFRGLGNILRHVYHRVDDQIIWNTIKDDLPSLENAVALALQRKPTGGPAGPDKT